MSVLIKNSILCDAKSHRTGRPLCLPNQGSQISYATTDLPSDSFVRPRPVRGPENPVELKNDIEGVATGATRTQN